MPFECLLHDAALHAFAAPVNQAHFTEAGLMSRDDVFVDDGWDVAWREGVKIECVFDWNASCPERSRGVIVHRSR